MKWLLDRGYDRKVVRRPINTEAKETLQRVGLDPEVAWVINRVQEGFPLSLHVHKHWFQAYNSKAVTASDKSRNVLQREYWPDTVMMGALEDDLRGFIRSMGRTVYTGSLVTQLHRIIPFDKKGAIGTETVSYFDDRNNAHVKTRVRFYAMPTRKQIMDHLRTRYGAIVDAMVETNDDPEPPLGSSTNNKVTSDTEY
jgi:hypothetical protein